MKTNDFKLLLKEALDSSEQSVRIHSELKQTLCKAEVKRGQLDDLLDSTMDVANENFKRKPADSPKWNCNVNAPFIVGKPNIQSHHMPSGVQEAVAISRDKGTSHQSLRDRMESMIGEYTKLSRDLKKSFLQVVNERDFEAKRNNGGRSIERQQSRLKLMREVREFVVRD
ncbi:hypothetical protein ACOME3_002788 [Neoechinorhynchus agilis]